MFATASLALIADEARGQLRAVQPSRLLGSIAEWARRGRPAIHDSRNKPVHNVTAWTTAQLVAQHEVGREHAQRGKILPAPFHHIAKTLVPADDRFLADVALNRRGIEPITRVLP